MEPWNTNAYNHQLGVPLWLMMSPEIILEVGEEIGDIVRTIVMTRLVRNIQLCIKSKFYKKRGATFFYDVTRKLGPLDESPSRLYPI